MPWRLLLLLTALLEFSSKLPTSSRCTGGSRRTRANDTTNPERQFEADVGQQDIPCIMRATEPKLI